MKKIVILMIVGILVVAIVGLASLFYFDSTKDYSQTILSNCKSLDCLIESLTDLSKTEDRETMLSTFSGITKLFQDSGEGPEELFRLSSSVSDWTSATGKTPT